MKIKNALRKIFDKSKKGLSEYKGTLLLILINTIVLLITTYNSDFIENFRFLFFANVFVFASETFIKENKKRIPFYILSVLLSAIFDYIIFLDGTNKKIILFLLSIYIISIILSFFKLSKKENSFSNYLVSVFNNNIILAISSTVLQTGLLFLVFIIQALLFNNIDEDTYLRVEILFLGFFLVPGELICLTNTTEEELKPVKNLIKYIMLPLVIAIAFVIYIYLFKVLVIKEIPSNTLFGIISALFAFGYVTWLMARRYENENKFIKYSSLIIPYAFIPLIIMQIYSIGIRINDFGFTVNRYIGVIYLIFEISCIVFSLLKDKNKINYILISGAILLFITMSVPFINVIDVSTRSQLNRLKKVYPENKKFEDLSVEEKMMVKNSYNYIRYTLYNKEVLPSYIDKDSIDEFYYYEYDKSYSNYDFITYDNNDEYIVVSGYTSFKPFTMDDYLYDWDNTMVEDLQLKDISNYIYKDNVKKFIKDAIDNKKVYNNIIILDEQTEFFVNYASIRYNVNTGSIANYNLGGYLLKK